MRGADSEFLHKEPCPACQSRDNLARYSDGHGYCFGCGHYEPAEGVQAKSKPKRERMTDFIKGEAQALTKRGLTEEACRKYGYLVGKDKHGRTVQVATYRRDGQIVAQKLRYPNKEFSFIGDSKKCGLYGQHLYQPGRRLVITEGEIDAISVAQALGLRWPVVSVPNGAQGAAKAISRELEWVEGFDEVVIMFDMDEPGQAAAQEVALLLTPGKARIAQLPAKDANELLQKGDAEAIVRAVYEAQTKRPDGIVAFGDLREKALTPPTMGVPWPWEELNALTFGRHYGEVYGFGAGTGIGKTDLFMEVAKFTAVDCNEKIALFYLEQPPVETAKRLAGKFASKRFHVPDGSWTSDELTAAFDAINATGNVWLYDHFGSCEWDVVLGRMRHLAVAEGVKHFFLDHLTAFAAEAEDEKKVLEQIMAQMAGFAQQHHVIVYFISHLATPEGKPHEEGGRVMIRHFKGSRAIGFWSHLMVGLERDQQAEDERVRSTTTFRILKDRRTGQATGKCLFFRYDHTTGRLLPSAPPGEDDDCPFPTDDNDNSDY